MASKRRKRKRRARGASSTPSEAPPSRAPEEGVPKRGSGGGVMQGLRSGFQRAAGGGEASEKPSTASNVLWTIVLLAAVGLLLYRWYG